MPGKSCMSVHVYSYMGGQRCRHISDTSRPYRQNRYKRNLFDKSQIKLVPLQKIYNTMVVQSMNIQS